MDQSKNYNNAKLRAGIIKSIISFLAIILFVTLGLSKDLDIFLQSYIQNNYLRLVAFVGVLGFIGGVFSFPFSYYLGFYLEHKFNLSNQTFIKWFYEGLKGLAVGLIIGIPILILFYFVLNKFGNLWWVVFSTTMFFISVILAQIVPVLILPIFYKISPLENEELKSRILKLCNAEGLKVENIYQFDMSKNTKKANAAFTGLGKTKRILLGDTLLTNFSLNEIVTVIAHELGHFKKNHIVKNLIYGTVLSYFTFFIIAQLYQNSLELFGFSNLNEIAALPLLTIWATIINFIETPLSNYLSRTYEYQADEFAVRKTNMKQDFINTLKKLYDHNLSDPEPNKFIEWYSYSHPSINRRIKFIEGIIIG